MTKVAANRVRVTTFKRVAKSRKPVVVQLDGKDCAVIMPIEDVDLGKAAKKAARGPANARAARALPPVPKLPKDDPTGWKAIDSLRGVVKHAPKDLSENHDKYLYGDPPK